MGIKYTLKYEVNYYVVFCYACTYSTVNDLAPVVQRADNSVSQWIINSLSSRSIYWYITITNKIKLLSDYIAEI